jgi:hypothetical protein
MGYYHLSTREEPSVPMCNEFQPGDVLVPYPEALDPDGRHVNCPACDQALHHGRAHTAPPS